MVAYGLNAFVSYAASFWAALTGGAPYATDCSHLVCHPSVFPRSWPPIAAEPAKGGKYMGPAAGLLVAAPHCRPDTRHIGGITASESLQQAGVSVTESQAILQKQVERAMRLYFRAGRKVDPGLRAVK